MNRSIMDGGMQTIELAAFDPSVDGAFTLTYEYLHSLFVAAGLKVTYGAARPDLPSGYLAARYRGASLIFSLHHRAGPEEVSLLKSLPYDAAFITAGTEKASQPMHRIFPFSPHTFGVTIWDYKVSWELYEWLAARELYQGAPGNNVLCAQGLNYPGCELREQLYLRLAQLKVQADFTFVPPTIFFEKISYVRLAVLAVGWGTVDKTPLQLMALGCPVAVSRIEHHFPIEQPIAGEHYLPLDDDFANLEELLGTPTPELRRIGANAKELFRRSLTPRPLMDYLERTIRSL